MRRLPTVRAHPRNYFQKTGIGSTQRKFGSVADINWSARTDEARAAKYCDVFVHELIRASGYVDTAFSTANPILRSQCAAHENCASHTTLRTMFDAPREERRLPFRALLGISSGADSSMTATVLCEALKARRERGIQFPTDHILLVSFFGEAFNKVDSKDGFRFGEYLKETYPTLPIDSIQVEAGTDDCLRTLEAVLPLVPDEEITTNIRIPLDFHKAAILNQIAEAYNFLHVDTTNLTEEALGETTDGTGGYGHISIPLLPKSLVYRVLDYLRVPAHLGRNSVDTCTNENKMAQCVEGEPPAGITTKDFFDILDRVILMFLSDYSLKQIVDETGHSDRFVQSAMQRVYLALHREKMGGYPCVPKWRENFHADTSAFVSQFHNFPELQNIFSIMPRRARTMSPLSHATTR